MDMKNLTARAAAAATLAFVAAVPACAQTVGAVGAPTLSFTTARDRDSAHTILLISATVMVIGILDDDTTLTVLGGAGVVYSLYESGEMRYQLRGADVLKSGPMSLGVNPASRTPQGFTNPRPSAYVQVKFKF